jgi:hypothetical protein
MLQAVEGIYRNGTIELLETPTNINESRVLITFLSSPAQQQKTTTTLITLGMFKGPQQSTEDDFILAQFQDDREDGLD